MVSQQIRIYDSFPSQQITLLCSIPFVAGFVLPAVSNHAVEYPSAVDFSWCRPISSWAFSPKESLESAASKSRWDSNWWFVINHSSRYYQESSFPQTCKGFMPTGISGLVSSRRDDILYFWVSTISGMDESCVWLTRGHYVAAVLFPLIGWDD